jgi:electron transfer flavoprotein alpha subunit
LIVVFAELGGEKLLGKARELGDSSALRVVAVCSAASKKSEKLISLGADEVVTHTASTVSEWAEVLSSMLREDSKIKYILFPSNLIADMILGSVYAKSKERIGSFLDGAVLSENGASKDFFGSVLEAKNATDKVSIFSLQTGSVSEPFEDTSRYGKTVESPVRVTPSKNLRTPKLSDYSVQDHLDSSSSITLLVGAGFSNSSALGELASKLRSRLIKLSGAVEEIYGPCLAIEVSSALRELPDFRGDLVSINSREAPISSVANLSVVTQDVEKVISELARSA